MKTCIRILFFSLIAFMGVKSAQGTHLMGGDLTYRHLHDSTYELTFLVYRDCNSGQANIDPRITYWVYYKKSKNVFLNNKTVNLFNNTAEKVVPEAPNCVTPSGVCIESGKYIDTVTLGSDPDGYIVNWYRLERNHDIANLKRCVSSTNNTSCTSGGCNNRNPYGMVWTAEIPGIKFENSSPQFLTVPVPYFCTGITNSFNHVVFDPDGDSLVFKIVTPLSPDECSPAYPTPSSTSAAPAYSSVYQTVNYQSGYSATKPFGGSSSAISINSTTGEMKANPSSSGSYVIAVKIEEYRVDPVTKKSTYLGSIRRDLQFIAGNCPNVSNSPPYFSKAGSSTIEVNPGDTIQFDIEVKDNSDTVYMKANGSIFGVLGSSLNPPFASFRDTQGLKGVTQTFFWVPTCDHITYTSPHIFTINLSDEGCNSVQRTYSIYVRGRDIYTPPDINCLQILADDVISVNWDTLKNVQFFNGLHVYRVDPDGTRKKIKSYTDSTVVGFNDSTVTNATSSLYRYYLKIENSCGLEGYSSDSLSTVVLKHTVVNDKTLRFDWNAYGKGPYKYYLQKKSGSTFSDVDSTTKTFLDYTSCILNTDFRIKVADTTNYSRCIFYSTTTTSTTVDNTPPSGAPELNAVSVLGYKRINVAFEKSSSSEVTQYEIYRSTNGGSFAGISTLETTQNFNNFTDNSSLSTNNTSYCYRIVAQDSCGNDGDTSLTHCTVDLKAYGGQREVKLRWNKYRGFPIDSQIVERYDSLNNQWKRLVGLGATDSTFLDNNNTLCGFEYHYRIRTFEKAFSNPYVSVSDSISLRPKDTIAAPAVDIVGASIIDDTTATVIFKSSPSADVKDYLVLALEYDGSSLKNTYANNFVLQNQDTFKVQVKTPNNDTRKYCFGVIAIDSCGQNFSPNAEIHCPSLLTGIEQNLANSISWTNYDGFTVDSFIVESKESGVWESISEFGRTRRSVVYSNLGCNVPVEYRIKVKERTTGQIIYSNDITLTPFDTINPNAAIVNFTTVENDTSITFEWDQSTSGDVYKYEIFSAINGGGLTLLDSVIKGSKSTESYTHQPITAKTDTFSYRVIAIDSCSVLNRSVSNVRQDAMQLIGEGANQENRIEWSAYHGFNVKEYQVEKLDKITNNWALVDVVNSSTTNYLHEDLNCFDTTTYRIKAIDNNSSFISLSDTIKLKPFDTISPIPPVIKYVSVVGNNSIKVAWNKSTSDDANKYVLYRKSATSKYQVLDTLLNKFEYTDNASSDSIWTYALIAIDSCIENPSYYKSDGESNLVLSSQAIGCQDSLQLTWNPYLTFENGLASYEIYRKVDSKPEALLATVNNSTTSYTDKVSQHLNYVYRIKAIENGGQNESYSQAYNAEVFKTPVPRLLSSSIVETDLNNGEIKIDWEKQEGKSQVSFSRLYYKEFNSASYTLLVNNIDLKDSTYTHVGLNTKNVNHQYFLVNVDSCSTISDTMSIHKTMDMQFGYGQLEHNLSWTAYEGYNVEYYILQQLISGSYVNIDTVSGSASTFRRFPAPCNTPIIYRIAAQDLDSNIAYSDTTVGTAIDLTSPNAPTLENISVIDDIQITIDFEGGDSLDTYGYAIEKSRNGGAYITSAIVLFTNPKQSVIFRDTVKLDSIRYAYRVVSLDSCLNASSSSVFKPIALKGNPGNFENHLAWHPFVGYPVDSYVVEMQDGNNWTIVGSTQATDTAFTHSGIGCNAPVTYRVRAEQGTGGNALTISNWIELTPFDTISPVKPSFYSASVVNSKQLKLNWSYDSDSDVKYYEIFKEDAFGNYNPIDTVEKTNTYIDSVLNARDSIYSYKILAIDSCNSNHISPYSDTVTNFIFNYSLDTCDPTTYLSWTMPKGLLSNVEMYIINRSTDGRPFRNIDTVMAPLLSYADSSVASGSTYNYRITAYNTQINQGSSTDTQTFVQTVRPYPKAPTSLFTSVITTDDLSGEVELAWNKITQKDDPFVIGYRVYGADTITNSYNFITQLNSRNDTSYIHTTPTSKKYNYYRVTAINTCNIDGDSSVLNAPMQLQVENLNLAARLKWSEYYGFDVSQYNVYHSTGSGAFTLAGTVPANTFSFRDTSVGCGELVNFRIEAVSSLGFNAFSDIENVTGYDTTLPKPTTFKYVSVVNDNEIELKWNASESKDAKFYTISYKRFSLNKWDTLVSNLTSLSYSTNTLNVPKNNPWQFRVSVTDSCGNQQPTPSPEHHHVALEASTVGPNTSLKWMNYNGWTVKEFEVYRDNNLINTIPVGLARADSLFSYIDTSIGCDSTIYDYHLIAVSDSGVTSKSNNDTTWGIDRSTPPSVYLRSASALIDNSGVRLSWSQSGTSDIKTYNILRKTLSSDSYSLVKKVDKSSINTIDTVNLNESKYYCYKISVEDACANEGVLSNEGCIMVLNGGNLKRANGLRWNAYGEWPDSVDHYEVFRGTDSVNLAFIANVDNNVRTFVDTNLNDTFLTYCYRVKAVEKDGQYNEFAWSTLLCATQEPLIYIPNAFSPELSEGVNDFFGPKGAFVPLEFKMSIYNRWGQRVYETTQGDPWSGKFADQSYVPDGVYLYIIEMTTANGETYVRKGNVKVFR